MHFLNDIAAKYSAWTVRKGRLDQEYLKGKNLGRELFKYLIEWQIGLRYSQPLDPNIDHEIQRIGRYKAVTMCSDPFVARNDCGGSSENKESMTRVRPHKENDERLSTALGATCISGADTDFRDQNHIGGRRSDHYVTVAVRGSSQHANRSLFTSVFQANYASHIPRTRDTSHANHNIRQISKLVALINELEV